MICRAVEMAREKIVMNRSSIEVKVERISD